MNLPFEQFFTEKNHQGLVIILITPDMNLSYMYGFWISTMLLFVIIVWKMLLCLNDQFLSFIAITSQDYNDPT